MKVLFWVARKLENAVDNSKVISYVNDNEEKVMRWLMIVGLLVAAYSMLRDYVL